MAPSLRGLLAVSAAVLIVVSVGLLAWKLAPATAGVLALGLLWVTRRA